MKKELLAFQKSDIYKDMIKKTINRRIDLSEKILNMYKEGVDTSELKYNFHNHYYEIANTFRGAIEELQDDSKGAVAFKKELIWDIEKYEEWIVGRMNNGYWAPYSSMQITEVDLMRSRVVWYKIIEELLGWMIIATEKPEEPKFEWAF